MTKTLDKKYRPQTLTDLVGNDGLKESLESILNRDDDIPGSFLFHGPSGCGKTTLARIVAKRIGGSVHTIQELNISNMTGVDTARNIIKKAKYAPFGGKRKVYILNECHKASNAFQNAMLEILEEPPPNCHFILCTTEPLKLLKTVRSRCTSYQVSKLSVRDISKLLREVCEKEEIEIMDDLKNLIGKIAGMSEGSPRQALVMMDSVIDVEDMETVEETLIQISGGTKNVLELYKALHGNHSWKGISGILKGIQEEPERVRHAILTMAEKRLLSRDDIRAFDILEAFAEPFYIRPQLTTACYNLFITGKE